MNNVKAEGVSVARTNVLRIACSLVALSLMQPVYADTKFPEYPVRPAGEYAVKAEKAGLIIGIQPVEDPKDQNTYFNTELTSKGVIPVFVVLQNVSSGDSFLFDKSSITYGQAQSSDSSPDVRSKTGQRMLVASNVLGSPVLAIFAMNARGKALAVKQNIVKKEAQSTTLRPGASTHGFLYVPVTTGAPRQKIHLQVPIIRTGTGETFVLDFTF